ncbi:hypothetical protein EV363DRAFT_1165856, partial [Boletus edulis]
FKNDVKSHVWNTAKEASCTDNWKTANPGGEEHIKVFKQTRIFLLACQHGFVDCHCSHNNSFKYALFIVNQILTVCGQDQGIGHNIGCVLKGTITLSSLGEKANEANLKIVVNMFHGFAHNWACQLENHPLYL